MNTQSSKMTHGVFLILVGALLMLNPFGIVAFVNFIIGGLILMGGVFALLPALQLPVPLNQKLAVALPGIGLILLGLFVTGNPKFLLLVLSFSFLVKSIQGIFYAYRVPSYASFKRSLMISSIVNFAFAAIIFFNVGAAVSSVIFIIGTFLVISGGVDVLQALSGHHKSNVLRSETIEQRSTYDPKNKAK